MPAYLGQHLQREAHTKPKASEALSKPLQQDGGWVAGVRLRHSGPPDGVGAALGALTTHTAQQHLACGCVQLHGEVVWVHALFFFPQVAHERLCVREVGAWPHE